MDLQLAERESALIGQDFLTWLWYASETRSGLFRTPENLDFALHFEQRVSVQGGDGESVETATVSSPRGELGEAKNGLRRGKKVIKAQLRLEINEDAWLVTVKADDFSLSGLKAPKMDTKLDEDDDPDAPFLEKMFLVERALELLDAVFAEFIRLRVTPQWKAETQAVGAWIEKG